MGGVISMFRSEDINNLGWAASWENMHLKGSFLYFDFSICEGLIFFLDILRLKLFISTLDRSCEVRLSLSRKDRLLSSRKSNFYIIELQMKHDSI